MLLSLKHASLVISIAFLSFGAAILLPGEIQSTVAQSTQNPSVAALQEANRLFKRGVQQYRVNQITGALRSFQQALTVYQQLGDRRGEAEALLFLGLAYASLKQHSQAIAYSEQALSRLRALRDINGEALALMNLGSAYLALSQHAKAVPYLEQALPLHQMLRDREGRAVALMNLGSAYLALSQHAKAIPYLEQAVPLFRAMQNPDGEGVVLNDLGDAYFALSQYPKAITYYQQALSLYQVARNHASEAAVLNQMGSAHAYLSQYPEAIRFFEQALLIYRARQDREGEAKMLGNLSNAYYSMSQYAKAIASAEQALIGFRALKDRHREAAALAILGKVHLSLSQHNQALGYYQQALSIFRELRDRKGEANLLTNLVFVYGAISQSPKAIAYLEQALPIYRAEQNREGEAAVLINLGNVHLTLAQAPKAIAYYQQVLPLFQELGDRSGEAKTFSNLGAAYDFLLQYDQAIPYYRQALSILREVKDRNGEAIALSNLGGTLLATGELAQAESLLRQSIQLRECLRAGLTDDQKVSIFEDQKNAYQNLQQVLVKQNRYAEALEIAERGRTRAFVELLAQRLNLAPASSEICTPVEPPTLAQIQQIARQQSATLVEYSVIQNELLYIWVIQPNGQLHFRSVDLKAQLNGVSLAEWIKAIRYEDLNVRGRGLGAVRSDIEINYSNRLGQANLTTLHQWLIAPIADLLPNQPDERVIFIPQDALFLVPFAALRDTSGRYLIEQQTIATAPSIQTLALTHQQKRTANQKQQPGRALIVGNPAMPKMTLAASGVAKPLAALPGAEVEAKALAKLFQTPALIGASATEAKVKAQMPQATLIHLATHGLLDDNRALNSSLALTPGGDEDGFLTAAEIIDLPLQAQLVVLSACDTGRGKITGDGVIGLSRSLISAGIPSVIVSLWAVPDAPTAFLMTEFYKNLAATPDKAHALRQAMLTTRKNHPEPRDWAAFILIGES